MQMGFKHRRCDRVGKRRCQHDAIARIDECPAIVIMVFGRRGDDGRIDHVGLDQILNGREAKNWLALLGQMIRSLLS